MTGPKHLWSGDWERDSAEPAAPLPPARPTGPHGPPAAQTAPPADRPRPHTSLRRSAPLAIVLAATVLAAGAVIAVATSNGNGTPPRKPAPQQTTPNAFAVPPSMTTPQTIPSVAPPTTTNTGPTGPTRRVAWLGMEIVNAPGGGAVIETVKLGSEGDQVGLNPGDLITSLNGHQITDPSQIRSAIAGLRSGAETMISVDRGSSEYATTIFLGAPPKAEP